MYSRITAGSFLREAYKAGYNTVICILYSGLTATGTFIAHIITQGKKDLTNSMFMLDVKVSSVTK
jgi:hypothetical protein